MQFTQQFTIVAKKSYIAKTGESCTYIQMLYISPNKDTAELKGYKLLDGQDFAIGENVQCVCEYNRYGLHIKSVS
jgi:hypothetical protein